MSLGTSEEETLHYKVFTESSFTASAILTLHAPRRESDPFDTRLYRTRWPALLPNCSVRASESYGVGVRFHRHTLPAAFVAEPLALSPDPGDFFIFNGEYLHDTPTINEGLRLVLNSFIGMSEHSDEVTVFA